MHPGKSVSLSDGVLSSHSFLHRHVSPGVSQEITVLAGRQASIPLFWPGAAQRNHHGRPHFRSPSPAEFREELNSEVSVIAAEVPESVAHSGNRLIET